MLTVVPENNWKTKSSYYVKVPVYPFCLSKLKNSHFHEDEYQMVSVDDSRI